jgi:hypothetical protein
VPKRHCSERAGWKLAPGKAAKRLSEHYKLDCDFGKPVIEIYKAGGDDPVYLCDGHVADVKPSRPHSSEIRLVQQEVEIAATPTSAPVEQAKQPALEIAATKPPATPRPEVVPTAKITGGPGPTKIERVTAARAARPPARDLAYGNSAKALVDEAIWNLATGDYELYKNALRLGKSNGEAAQAAGGQLAVVHRKICEYAVKIETVLAASTAKIDAAEVIDKEFERAMAEIIANEALADAEKDAAIEQLGVLQESVNRGVDREISLLDAHRIACVIGERANWGASVALPEVLKTAYRAIYGSVRTAVRAAAPHANVLEERLTNLYAAKADLENGPRAKTLQVLSA